jgi:quercetin dioxygenase-like cupin family protein
MSAFSNASDLAPIKIWDGVVARAVDGEEATLALIDLEPNTQVPEHHHVNEQTGILIGGSMSFTVGGETKEIEPGEMWVIPAHVPHSVVAGPEGARLAELFAPPRADWAGLERLSTSPVTLP